MSADILDDAADYEQHMIDVALANRKLPKFTFTGKCENCGEIITRGSFCPGGECREDYDRRERLWCGRNS